MNLDEQFQRLSALMTDDARPRVTWPDIGASPETILVRAFHMMAESSSRLDLGVVRNNLLTAAFWLVYHVKVSLLYHPMNCFLIYTSG